MNLNSCKQCDKLEILSSPKDRETIKNTGYCEACYLFKKENKKSSFVNYFLQKFGYL